MSSTISPSPTYHEQIAHIRINFSVKLFAQKKNTHTFTLNTQHTLLRTDILYSFDFPRIIANTEPKPKEETKKEVRMCSE